MKNINLFKLLVVAVGLFSICVTSSVQAQSITTSTLTLTYSGETGVLVILNEFDARTPRNKSCTLTVRGAVHYEGETTTAAVRRLAKISITGRKSSVRARLTKVKAVRNNDSDALGIFDVQTILKCRGSDAVVSNADAVFAHCGKGAQEVAAGRFLKEISDKLSDI